ncbi:exported hypothetical protein [uncultured Desulfobacterium sp.]|uniref:DUF5666 domain-containing protein n=1 Tax=uncultured Desulfobacterium sp. TaxID=201089 RepID=A0A445N1S6_9BACT|nr:exported hypothetical protein [uncultured Desulfobacterium sp.]
MKRTLGYCLGLFAVAFILYVCHGLPADQSAFAEEESITITGKITSITYGMFTPFGNRRAEIVVLDKSGDEHVIRVGQRTAYIPHRTPTAGDRVSIVCIRQDDSLAGVTVTYK